MDRALKRFKFEGEVNMLTVVYFKSVEIFTECLHIQVINISRQCYKRTLASLTSRQVDNATRH